MKRLISVIAPSFALVALIGCGASRPQQPPAELQAARQAYQRAESGSTAQNNPAGLIEARQALDAAERAYGDWPGSEDAKTLGYVAQRKAEIAEATARAEASQQGEVEKERQATGRSERRAKVALGQLGLEAKEEARGTVITVPGASMFETDKAEIRPGAKGRLNEVAKGVKKILAEKSAQDVGRKIYLIGYTDDVGDEEHNVDLSKRRADAVRDFFSEKGLDVTIMETKGQGEADPIADNTTPKGRAQNRRVEIVITPPAPAGGGAAQ